MSETTTNAAQDADLLTLKEAAILLRISAWTLNRLINTGALPTVRIGRRRLVIRRDYDTFVMSQREEFERHVQ